MSETESASQHSFSVRAEVSVSQGEVLGVYVLNIYSKTIPVTGLGGL
jgi:hypothetical protein